METIPDWARMSLYMVVLLVSIALALSLALGSSGTTLTTPPAETPRSHLPATVPGLSRDEGVFLSTAADDGSRAMYFIAQNTRHSIAPSDWQTEQQLNPLWPVRAATHDEVLAFGEGAPIGSARTGLVVRTDAPAEVTADTAQDETASPAATTPSPVAEVPSPVAEVPSPVVAAPSPVVAAPSPVAEIPGPVAEIPSPVAQMPSTASASAMPHAPTALADTPINADPGAAEPTLYVLQSGDNLIRLSARYGTSVAAILAANSIANPNLVFVGRSIVIPAPAPKTPDVVEVPGAPAPIANAPEQVADSPASDYTVKRGDSAIRIARQFGIDVDQLVAENGVVDRNRVYVGQVLSIPGG